MADPDPVQVVGSCREVDGRGPGCRVDPFILVIFGASGDLAARKLIPALFHLFRLGYLPKQFGILGAGRTDMGTEGFRDKAREVLATEVDQQIFEKFESHLFYQKLVYDSPSSFEGLAEEIRELDKKFSAGEDWIYYLSVPPSSYTVIADGLGKSGLAGGRGDHPRIVVEKPFGRDLNTARELDRSLHQSFEEKQIFRIDHYLAKETVQNILVLRFANAIFEPLWNRRYINHVAITATETLGVEHRAGYYEQSGVIRDMFQNHMMQLLALTAMEPPSVFSAERVQDEKVKVFRSLRPFPTDQLDRHLVLGQYADGIVDGQPVPSYRREPGVDPASLTPTFARMQVFIDNWRWQGVPFTITSGKRLSEKRTEIAIQFKEVPHSMFRDVLGEHITANRLILGIQPQEVVNLTFQTKLPGIDLDLRSVTMHFDYQQGTSGPPLDGYSKVLLDCLLGEHLLFWRKDGVRHSWSFLTPVLKRCESCPDQATRLQLYPAGSDGPP